MKDITCLAEYQLEYCGDSVEWCPNPSYSHFFVCGCYELKEESRYGCLDLFSFTNSDLKLVHRVDTGAGVLDSKWAPYTWDDMPLLAGALSDGTLRLYRLEDNEMKLVNNFEVQNKGMVLSVDWSIGVDSRLPPRLVVSCTDGSIHIIQVTDNSLTELKSFKAHNYEAWASAFNYWDTNIIYTGGDDCKLNVFDLRINGTKPIISESSHSVGVTCIRSNSHHEGYLASASYEDVRIWSWSGNKLCCIDKEEMSGGSWRVKWKPEKDKVSHLAVAAMHTGFSALQYSEPDSQPHNDTFSNSNFEKKIRCDFKGPHTSLGYGIDWSHKGSSELALCSFYDRKLSVVQLV